MFKVAVIGCGPNGLNSALAIQEKLKNRVSVTIYTKEVSPNTTADVAACVWSPPNLVPNCQQEKVTQWSGGTYRYLLNLWKTGKAKEFGITFQPVIMVSTQTDYVMPDWIRNAIAYDKLSRKQLDDLSKLMGVRIENEDYYMGFTWEASVFLPRLQRDFLKNGGEIVMKEISNFDQLKNVDLIVNCAGYQSRFLTDDVDLKPIRGQVTRVSVPWQKHVVMLDCDDGGHIGHYYIIPNTNCVVLGSTADESDDLGINDDHTKYIMNGCSKCVPSLNNAEVVRHSVGLRPGRNKIRLELDTVDIENRLVPIIHNYGHGACGVMLSVGCSKEVASMAEDVFKQRKPLNSKL